MWRQPPRLSTQAQRGARSCEAGSPAAFASDSLGELSCKERSDAAGQFVGKRAGSAAVLGDGRSKATPGAAAKAPGNWINRELLAYPPASLNRKHRGRRMHQRARRIRPRNRDSVRSRGSALAPATGIIAAASASDLESKTRE